MELGNISDEACVDETVKEKEEGGQEDIIQAESSIVEDSEEEEKAPWRGKVPRFSLNAFFKAEERRNNPEG